MGKNRGKWEQEILYCFEERVTILEFDAGLSRKDVEPKAFTMMLLTSEQKKN